MSIAIVISGATGRVGRAACELIRASDAHCLVGALASDMSTAMRAPGDLQLTINAPILEPVDAVIDFSTDAGCRRATALALEKHAALVVATTGLSEETSRQISCACETIPVICAANTSPGAVALAALAADASRALGTAYDISIVEAHRKHKLDAPSGTALWIAQRIRAGGGVVAPQQVLSIRAGDAAGEHTVRFTGSGEVIELTHRVTSREVFAIGALRAATWLVGKPAGRHRMDDVLRK